MEKLLTYWAQFEAMLPTIGYYFMLAGFFATIALFAATYLVKFTESKDDDIKVEKAKLVVRQALNAFIMVAAHLPNIGADPRVKQMQKRIEQLEAMQKNDDIPKAS